jgi:hypothetical protein
VDCQQLETLAREGVLPKRRSDPEIQAHLEQCNGCRALYAGEGHLARSLTELPFSLDLDTLRCELASAFEQEDSSLAGRLRALPSTQRRAVLSGVGLLMCLLTALVLLRADFRAYDSARMVGILVVLTALAALASWEALRPLSVAPTGSRRTLLIGFGVFVPVALALLPEAESAHRATTAGASLLVSAFKCLGIGLGAATPVIVAWRWLDRVGIASAGGHLRVLVAAMGGLYANAVLQLHCPITHSTHLLFGHATVSGVLVLALLAVRRNAAA